MQITIKENGYTPAECDQPLPCPFCGSEPKLQQVAHHECYEGSGRNRRKVRIMVVSSSRELSADTFWFQCASCKCKSGGMHESAQLAAEAWNRRA